MTPGRKPKRIKLRPLTEAELEAYLASLRPQQIGEYREDGMTVRVFEPRFAEGWNE